jgi:phage-related protein
MKNVKATAWQERRYSSYSFSTSALDESVSGQRHAPATL